jgi:hypothetical protein
MECKDPTSEDMESWAEHRKVLEEHELLGKKGAPNEHLGHLYLIEGTELEKFWIPEEIGRRQHDGYPSCRSGTVQGARTSGTQQGWCCTHNFEKTEFREQALAEDGTQNLDEDQRPETTATKQQGIQQDPKGVPTTGFREASSRDA